MEATQTECPYCVKYRKYLEKRGFTEKNKRIKSMKKEELYIMKRNFVLQMKLDNILNVVL